MQMAARQTDLADVLANKGDYAGARAGYEAALVIFAELGDLRSAAVVNGQLGSLALRQNELPEAARRYLEALTAFQRLGKPAIEARFWHNPRFAVASHPRTYPLHSVGRSRTPPSRTPPAL
jgi:tetratricopeptide (TPR) repeat protein